jgi:FkbM family methyltransferase
MSTETEAKPANVTEGNVDRLVRECFFPDGYRGVMVEIGAASPDFLSLGNSFLKAGWRVLSVEPNPIFAEQHRKLGHEIHEYACSQEDRDDVSFTLVEARNLEFEYKGGKISFESFSSLGIRDDFRKLFSGMEGRFATREIKVKTRRLDTILDGIVDLPPVDIVAIDTEGWELECLKGFSLDRFAPKVLIIEDLFGRTALDTFLLGHGYVRWQRITPNNVYVPQGKATFVKTEGFLPPMTTYTPNLEDVLLRRCFPMVADGFYVDIGAHHPTNASVTRWFYERGWSGINVEPGDGIAALRADRRRDINLELAVSDHAGETTFWVHSGNTGTSTLQDSVPKVVAERAGEIRPLKVKLSTLTAILDEHAPDRHMQFLKIDAEGAEDAIIAAADWTRYRPEVVVAESSEPYTNRRITAAWQKVLEKNRYRFAYFDGVNDFWVREESSHLLEAFRVPVNVLDFYKIYDPEVESLRSQVVALTAALKATKTYADTASEELARLREAPAASPVQAGSRRGLLAALARWFTGGA